MVSRRRALALVLLALAAGGCASLSSSPSTATLNAGVPTADELAAPYRAQAVDLERTGQLRQAAEAWTTALALAPDHESSRQALKRLRERIDRELNEHLKEGWHALARDNAPDARRHSAARSPRTLVAGAPVHRGLGVDRRSSDQDDDRHRGNVVGHRPSRYRAGRLAVGRARKGRRRVSPGYDGEGNRTGGGGKRGSVDFFAGTIEFPRHAGRAGEFAYA
jgi:hypothetical protein